MPRILSPREYYPSQTPLQARALGTQIGMQERQLADQEAQLGGRMAAGGYEDPRAMYQGQAEAKMAADKQAAITQGFTEVADIMDGANEMEESGYGEHVPEYLKSAWDNMPSMQRLFPEGAPTLNKKGNVVTSDPFVAGEQFPGIVKEPDNTSHDRGLTPGETYVSETIGDSTTFKRVPGTQELGAKGKKDKSGSATSALAWDKATSSILMKTQGTTTASGIVISPERQIETELATSLLNEYRRYDANTAVSKALEEARNIERQIPTYPSTNEDGEIIQNKKQIARMGKNKKTGKRVLQFTDGTTLEIN